MAKPPSSHTSKSLLHAGLSQATQLINHGSFHDAEVILTQLRQAFPLDPFVAYNLGVVLWKNERQEEAVRCWRQALAAKPDLGPAAINLGNALHILGLQREALRYCQMAVRIMPDLAGAWLNLGLVLSDLGESPAALDAIDRCLSLDPQHVTALGAKVDLLQGLKRHEAGESVARSLLSLPGQHLHGGALTGVILNAARGSRWEELPALQDQLVASVGQTDPRGGLLVLAWATDDPKLMRDLALAKAKAFVAPKLHARSSRHRDDERITVAYLSPDFREHPVAHMLIDVLQGHDRSRFRILTLGVLPKHVGPLNRRIDALTDGHLDLSQLEDAAAADLIRKQGVDILVDLAGATQWCRPTLLHARPAPVQVLWLGCPFSTGASCYDAFLVDDLVASTGYETWCSEPLVRLSCCYHPISTGLGIPNESLTRADVGLPEDAIVLGMLQNVYKVTPPLTELVARLLHDLPRTVLWINAQDPVAAQRIRSYFQARDIDPQRIHFADFEPDRSRYLGRQRLADLMIDTFPYGGHSTAGEAMALGVPVVTRAGRSIHSRVAASMLHRLGLDELVAWDEAAFADLIRRLVQNPMELARIRQRCQEQAHQLTSDQGRTLARALETAFQRLTR